MSDTSLCLWVHLSSQGLSLYRNVGYERRKVKLFQIEVEYLSIF